MVTDLTTYDGPRDRPVVGLRDDNVRPVKLQKLGKPPYKNATTIIAIGDVYVVVNKFN